MRINKYLSHMGVCSRREADELIATGMVTINGIMATLGSSVEEYDKVLVGKKSIDIKPNKKVIAYYKPRGVICTTKDKYAKNNIIKSINYPIKLMYAGRLDKESEGLIIMTNDGDLIDRLMRSSNNKEKEYIVKVNKPISSDFITKMSEKMYIKELGVCTRECKVERVDVRRFRIVLTQGLNRQIRRMCDNLGYTVLHLKRIRIANVLLGDMKSGEYRELNDYELADLYRSIYE